MSTGMNPAFFCCNQSPGLKQKPAKDKEERAPAIGRDSAGCLGVLKSRHSGQAQKGKSSEYEDQSQQWRGAAGKNDGVLRRIQDDLSEV